MYWCQNVTVTPSQRNWHSVQRELDWPRTSHGTLSANNSANEIKTWWIWSLILNTTGCYRPGVSVHTLGGHVPIIVLLLLTWTRLGEAGLAHLTHSLNTGILSWIKLISFIQNKPLSTEFWRLCSWSHKSEDLLKTYIQVIQKAHN